MPDQQTIEKPKTAKAPEKSDVTIYVMPKEFFGKEAGVKEIPKKPTPPPPPPIPKPVKPPAAAPKKKKKTNLILMIGGILIVLAFAIAAYFVIKSLEETQIEIEEPDVVEVPDVEEPDVEELELSVLPGRDTDGDGLTDMEETIYGTDFRNPDTDGDTFLDGNEVFHRYDPLGFSPSTLLDTGSVIEYSSNDGYTLTYPKQWTSQVIDKGMEFKSSTGSKIVLVVEDNEEGQEFTQWYEGTITASEREALLEDMTKEGYLFYKHKDLMTAYVEVEDRIFIFTYDVADAPTVDFLKTFQMMVNSLVVENE